MQAKAQVIPFEEDWISKQGERSAPSRRRPVPPGGAEVLVFHPEGVEVDEAPAKLERRGSRRRWRRALIEEEAGQGTTEYAILVGVLVVIAIMAILIFRDKVQELWTSIADGINSL